MVSMDVAAPAAGEAVAGSPAWHALRRTGIGGSDAAAALGLSPWRTRYELFLDKLGQLPAREATPQQLWGHRLQDLVLQQYANDTGRRVVVPRATFRSERHAHMLANLDGLADGRVVEAKTARTAAGWGEAGSDEIPLAYMLQVQHYMTVTALPVADVAVLIGGADFRIYEIPADAELQRMLVEGEAEFWQHVVRAEPPAPQSLEDARKRWGGLAVRGSVTATEADVQAVHSLAALLHEAKTLARAADDAKAHLMQRMGETGDALVDSAGRALVTWKLARGAERFDVEAFAAEHADLYAAYLRTGKPARRFLLKEEAHS